MTIFPDADNWRAGMQDVSAAIDETMGELVTVTPVLPVKPNFPSEPEPDKAVTARAVFTSLHKTVILSNERRVGTTSVAPLVSTREPIFSFGYGVLPFAVGQHYRITRVCSGETFEVTDVQPDGVSRIVCKVVQLGRQKEEY